MDTLGSFLFWDSYGFFLDQLLNSTNFTVLSYCKQRVAGQRVGNEVNPALVTKTLRVIKAWDLIFT